jgi:(2R)-3-sulfolactate dehydrogenase (NADP+)
MTGGKLTLDQTRALVADKLERARTSPSNAATVARALVAAAEDGLKGHGLSRLPSYAAQARTGKIDGFAKPTVSRPRRALMLIDAANGFARVR